MHDMEYYSAFLKTTILTQATTWTNPEDFMQSEISKTQKDKCYMIPCIQCNLNNQFIKTESRIGVTRGWEEGWMRSYILMSVTFQFGLMKKFLEMGWWR